ncbi:MAG: HAMP domain-containing sensor histidine kinase [Clostridia bacterium]|nr:HAMP domain-containing sensor histidine kinase [Clostridia bacterium]
MKSTWLKTIAFLLCILCIGGTAFQIFHIVFSGGVSVYRFEAKPEDQLEDSLNYILHLVPYLEEPWVQQELQESKVHYYFKLGDQIYQNDADLPNTYQQSEFYLELSKDKGFDGISPAVDSYQFNTEKLDEEWKDYRLIVQYPEEYVQEFGLRWQREKELVDRAFQTSLLLMIAALLATVYLFWVCGRKGREDRVQLLLIDRLPVELNMSAVFIIIVGMMGLTAEVGDSFEGMAQTFALLFAVFYAVAGAVVLGLLLSLVRNLKNKSFLQQSLIYRSLRWCWRLIWKVVRALGRIKQPIKESLRQKTGKTAVVGLVGYTLFLCFCMLFATDGSFFFFLILIAACVGACWWVARSLTDFEKVKNGIFAIRGGEVGYKIEGVKDGLMAGIAEAVNSLGEGLGLSLEREVRAERMKSELITNVSHDLKTPLTSIINYSELLCKEKLAPPEANEYASIILQKSRRLKKLTNDLFDISKVQSGTEQISRERLDLKVLVEQALAEVDEAASRSELEWVVSLEDNAFIWGDGRKLSRVFENLLMNVIKYAMKHTRVYVTVTQQGEAVIKNISAYPMNFDEGEITERFVRGDVSRSTEGSGLGLAIAKSYTQACGGSFAVTVDGDLFKVTMKFEPTEPQS